MIDVDLLRFQLNSKRGHEELAEKNLTDALKRASVFHILSPFLEMEYVSYQRLATSLREGYPTLYNWLNGLRSFGELQKSNELSPREKQVLQLLTRHLTNKEIGNQLNISEKTVKRHTGNLFKKLGVTNRMEAVALVTESMS